jgi:hypothetical protein
MVCRWQAWRFLRLADYLLAPAFPRRNGANVELLRSFVESVKRYFDSHGKDYFKGVGYES